MKNVILHMSASETLSWISAGDLCWPDVDGNEQAEEIANRAIQQHITIWIAAFEQEGYSVQFSNRLAPLSGWVIADDDARDDVHDLWNRTIGHLSYDGAESDIESIYSAIED